MIQVKSRHQSIQGTLGKMKILTICKELRSDSHADQAIYTIKHKVVKSGAKSDDPGCVLETDKIVIYLYF